MKCKVEWKGIERRSEIREMARQSCHEPEMEWSRMCARQRWLAILLDRVGYHLQAAVPNLTFA